MVSNGGNFCSAPSRRAEDLRMMNPGCIVLKNVKLGGFAKFFLRLVLSGFPGEKQDLVIGLDGGFRGVASPTAGRYAAGAVDPATSGGWTRAWDRVCRIDCAWAQPLCVGFLFERFLQEVRSGGVLSRFLKE